MECLDTFSSARYGIGSINRVLTLGARAGLRKGQKETRLSKFKFLMSQSLAKYGTTVGFPIIFYIYFIQSY